MADPRSLIDTYPAYINGQWVDPDKCRYDDVNPATETVIASAPDSSHAQVGIAIAAARAAFDAGPWGDAGPDQRAAFLNQLGEALLAHADDFVAADATGRSRPGPNHRRAQRNFTGRGQRRRADRHRIQQDADRRPSDRHGELHRKLRSRPRGDGSGRAGP